MRNIWDLETASTTADQTHPLTIGSGLDLFASLLYDNTFRGVSTSFTLISPGLFGVDASNAYPCPWTMPTSA